LTGLVPWTFFANGLATSSNSLVGNANLVSKVYFPRLSVPISSILSGLVDFALAFAMLLGLIMLQGVHVSGHVVWLPAFLLLSIGTSLGVGLWLSALNVEYRDVRYVVPFLIQFWMFATPVAYPSSLLKTEPWRSLYGLNPMVGVIEGFRWALLGTGRAPGAMLAISVAISVLLLIGGAYYFRRMEKNFADVI
jgi:lipopolysaccharide transport system permease protein